MSGPRAGPQVTLLAISPLPSSLRPPFTSRSSAPFDSLDSAPQQGTQQPQQRALQMLLPEIQWEPGPWGGPGNAHFKQLHTWT